MTIKNVLLGTSSTEIIKASTGETAVLSIVFCNTDTATRTITMYALPNGGSDGDTTTILKDFAIPAKDTFIWSGDEKLILETSAKINGICDVANKVSATTSYKVL